MSEAIIRQRIDEVAKAICAKDLERVMSVYAQQITSFDLTPPLRYTGADRKRQAWQEVFSAYSRINAYDIRELDVTVDGAVAFVHSLNHVSATLAAGHATDVWVRWTACFRRIGGTWLVVHDHVSVPADVQHGTAVLNLTP